MVGLYGMEEWSDPAAGSAEDPRGGPLATGGGPGQRRARAEVPAGAEVEDKGLTVTLHWRVTPRPSAGPAGFATGAGRDRLVAQPGRMALELRPPLDIDKGTVVAGWVGARRGGLSSATTSATCRLRRAGPLWRPGVAVARVAVADAESPPEVAAAADLVVDGPGAAPSALLGPGRRRRVSPAAG